MRTTLTALSALLLTVSVTACGKSDDSVSSGGTAGQPQLPGQPSAKLLSQSELDGAMVDLPDMPSGWSRDKEEEAKSSASHSSERAERSAGVTKSKKPEENFCGMDEGDPVDSEISATREFTKGAQLSEERIQVDTGRFTSVEDAKKSFAFGHEKLSRCKDFTSEEMGEVKVSQESGDKIGDESGRVRLDMKVQGMPVTMNFVYFREGATVTTVMGFGVTSSPTEAVTKVSTKQAEKLKAAQG